MRPGLSHLTLAAPSSAGFSRRLVRSGGAGAMLPSARRPCAPSSRAAALRPPPACALRLVDSSCYSPPRRLKGRPVSPAEVLLEGLQLEPPRLVYRFGVPEGLEYSGISAPLVELPDSVLEQRGPLLVGAHAALALVHLNRQLRSRGSTGSYPAWSIAPLTPRC